MSLDEIIADTLLVSHPLEAARALEALPDEDVVALLDESDPRVAAALITAMTPSSASRCLSQVSPEHAGAVLAALSLDRAAHVLRRWDAQARARAMDHVPNEKRKPLAKLLSFPPDTAGAFMEPRVASFHEALTVSEVLERARRADAMLRYYIYVVDDQQKLAGVVSVTELVSASDGSTLRSIMKRPVQTLSARAGKRAILSHPGWNRYPVLPVVDEADRLAGVFRYETFRALQGIPDSDEASPLGVALALGELFWWGASGVVRGLEGARPLADIEGEGNG